MSDEKNATPPKELERQIMSSLVPKNEREHWACGEIESLRQQVSLLRDAVAYGVDNSEFNSETFDHLLREALAATDPKP